MTRQLLRLPTGVSLEAELFGPPSAPGVFSEGNKLAVCLHPWSWLGGQMDDPVLHSLVELLQRRNYHILRFNSRGVGRSTGWSSFTGFSEAKDLEAMVQWGLGTVPDVRSLVVIGYSHGSLIASLHPVLPPPIKTSHILISYPLGTRGFLTLFNTSTYASKMQELLHNSDANLLVLFGDNDEFTAGKKYEVWARELQRETEGENKGSLKVVCVQDATHFWRGREGQDLQREIEGWLP